jgi:hypothetical protein
MASLTIDGVSRTYDIKLGGHSRAGEHQITFRLLDAHSPLSVGLNDDTRALGIAVSSISFRGPEDLSAKCE